MKEEEEHERISVSDPEYWEELLEGMSEVVYLDTPEKVKEWLDDDEQW